MSLTTAAYNVNEPVGDEVQFLDFPNEILTRFFENLSTEGRQILGSLNKRLNGVEKRSGRREFSSVCFSTIEKPVIVARDTSANKIRKNPSDETLPDFFRLGKTNSLVIEGSLNEEQEDQIITAFEPLDFKQLTVDLRGDNSGRIMADLLQGRCSIEQLTIPKWDVETEIDEARRVLMDLPSIERIRMTSSSSTLLNDEVFSHLVSIAVYTELSSVKETTITVDGLTRAFEMVTNSPTYKHVTCSVPVDSVRDFLDLKGPELIGVGENCFQHVGTGARFDCRFDTEEIVTVEMTSGVIPGPLN